MREPAIRTNNHTLLCALLVVSAIGGALGCGDDDDGDPNDAGVSAGKGGTGGRGGRGGSSAAGTGGTASMVTPLPDKTAGKSCDENKDCGSGTCLTTLPGAFGAPMVEAPGGYCTGGCMTDADCGSGGSCAGAFAGIAGIGATLGSCLKGCATDGDCRDGYRCVDGLGMPVSNAANGGAAANPAMGLLGPNTCQPRPATDKLADGIVGSRCATDGDCGDGRCMTMATTTTYPGGYCTGACLEDAECGSNGSCTLGLLGGVGTCYLNCSSDSDCSREGYRCRASGQRMTCIPGAPPLPDNVVGNACSADADCGGAAMSCAARLGFNNTAPDGYCTQRCVNSVDCGAGGVCVGGGGLGGATAGGTCYKSCAGASDCRDGYMCGSASRTGAGAMQNVCTVAPPPPDDAGI